MTRYRNKNSVQNLVKLRNFGEKLETKLINSHR